MLRENLRQNVNRRKERLKVEMLREGLCLCCSHYLFFEDIQMMEEGGGGRKRGKICEEWEERRNTYG